MFHQLTERLTATLEKFTAKKITESHMHEAVAEIRKALLEADVSLPVVQSFTDQLRPQILGQKITASVRPADFIIKQTHTILVKTMGETHAPIHLNTKKPTIILMAGLQGAGKTTTTAKLAYFLKNEKKQSVMVASTDIYRPAAMDQLAILSQEAGVTCYPSTTNTSPITIAKQALTAAKNDHFDVLIIDTAGRLHVDQAMMDEIEGLHKNLNPAETLFIVDSMTGQDATRAAIAFNEALPLSGIILTKTDSDSRGGAALSVKQMTGKPIKFLGVGEKIDALEYFHPDRIASRILGMGDILSLVEKAQKKLDVKKAEKIAKKLQQGKSFNFNDLKTQFQQMEKLGGMSSILNQMPKIPGLGNLAKLAEQKMPADLVKHTLAIINSMTIQERENPRLVSQPSRKKRIANGSGRSLSDVNRLIKQQEKMEKMMKQFKGNKLQSLMGRFMR